MTSSSCLSKVHSPASGVAVPRWPPGSPVSDVGGRKAQYPHSRFWSTQVFISSPSLLPAENNGSWFLRRQLQLDCPPAHSPHLVSLQNVCVHCLVEWERDLQQWNPAHHALDLFTFFSNTKDGLPSSSWLACKNLVLVLTPSEICLLFRTWDRERYTRKPSPAPGWHAYKLKEKKIGYFFLEN